MAAQADKNRFSYDYAEIYEHILTFSFPFFFFYILSCIIYILSIHVSILY